MRYLTKDWYLNCQTYPKSKALEEEINNTVQLFRREQGKEKLPEELLKRFMFHDGSISKIEAAADCSLEIDSPYSEYHKITFRDALIKTALPPLGATWLYEELYCHKSGVGYEAHILFFKKMTPKHKKISESDLFETKIICTDILFE